MRVPQVWLYQGGSQTPVKAPERLSHHWGLPALQRSCFVQPKAPLCHLLRAALCEVPAAGPQPLFLTLPSPRRDSSGSETSVTSPSLPAPAPHQDGAVVSYLCRSFISAGDQEEPYKVSCHCFKVPGLRLSSPGEETGCTSGELFHLALRQANPQQAAQVPGWQLPRARHGARRRGTRAHPAAPGGDAPTSAAPRPSLTSLPPPPAAGLTGVPDDQSVGAPCLLAPAPHCGEGPVSEAVGIPARGGRKNPLSVTQPELRGRARASALLLGAAGCPAPQSLPPRRLRVHAPGGSYQGHHAAGAEEPDLQVAAAGVCDGDGDCHVLQGSHTGELQVGGADWERGGMVGRGWWLLPAGPEVLPCHLTGHELLPPPGCPHVCVPGEPSGRSRGSHQQPTQSALATAVK